MASGTARIYTLSGPVFEGKTTVDGATWLQGITKAYQEDARLLVVVKDDGGVVAVPATNVESLEYVPDDEPEVPEEPTVA